MQGHWEPQDATPPHGTSDELLSMVSSTGKPRAGAELKPHLRPSVLWLLTKF